MKIPRDLSGRDLADRLCKIWDQREVKQTGSHIILQTETSFHQRLPVPAHNAIKTGTLSAIARQVATHKGIARDQVLGSLL